MKKILIVDDDLSVLYCLKQMIEHITHNVIVAESGEKALRIIECGDYGDA